MENTLTRSRGMELLNRLSENMPVLPQPADIYVVGGAAMMFEYDAARETEDIDCIIRRYREEVLEAAERVAEAEPGLSPDWLNEEASNMGLPPEAGDLEERLSYDGQRIRIASASPRRLLAMKLDSHREKDIRDIATLLEITGIESVDEAQQVFDDAYPHRKLQPAAARLVEALLKPLPGPEQRNEQRPEPAERPRRQTRPAERTHPRDHGR